MLKLPFLFPFLSQIRPRNVKKMPEGQALRNAGMYDRSMSTTTHRGSACLQPTDAVFSREPVQSCQDGCDVFSGASEQTLLRSGESRQREREDSLSPVLLNGLIVIKARTTF